MTPVRTRAVLGSRIRPGITTVEAVARIDAWRNELRRRDAEARLGGPGALALRDALTVALEGLYAGTPVELVRADLARRLVTV